MKGAKVKMESQGSKDVVKKLEQKKAKLERRRVKFLKDLRETTDSLDKSHLIYDIKMVEYEISLIQESLDEFARGEKIKEEALGEVREDDSCIRCGKQIPKGRLEFLNEDPTKPRLCVECHEEIYGGSTFLNRPSLKQVPFIYK